MSKFDLYANLLKQAGYRMTGQRRAICAYLANTDTHPTPYEVYAAVTRAHPEISRATVYNTLNVLQSLGAITEIALGSEHTHYETDPSPHINLICLRCHRIQDVHSAIALDELNNIVVESTDFQPVSARVDLLGFCADCRQRKKDEILAQWHSQRLSCTEQST